MVGFTAFSEASGEEAAFRLMQDVAKLTGDVVREQGGAVQSFMGDGLMAVFGAPVAYEDAPLKACRAALGIIDRLQRAADDFQQKFGARPQFRIGLNTGMAVGLCHAASGLRYSQQPSSQANEENQLHWVSLPA